MGISADLKEQIRAQTATWLNKDSGYQLVGIKDLKKKDGSAFSIVEVWDEKTTGLTLEFYEREVLELDVANLAVRVGNSSLHRALAAARKRAEQG